MASSFKEIINLIRPEKFEKKSERSYFVKVCEYFLAEQREIQLKVLPAFLDMIQNFPKSEKEQILK